MRILLVIFILGCSGCASLLEELRLPESSSNDEAMDWIKTHQSAPEREDSRMIEDVSPSRRQPASIEPASIEKPRARARVTRNDFINHSQEEGSLWASTGQTNYYFTKNKVRSPGDIVSIQIEKDLLNEIGAEFKYALTPEEAARELELMRARVLPENEPKSSSPKQTASATGTGKASSTDKTSSAEEPQKEKLKPKLTLTDADLLASLQLQQGDLMMGEILERFPNGNYRIRATKRVLYKNGMPRWVNVMAIVRPSDINEDSEIVSSGKVYEPRIEIIR